MDKLFAVAGISTLEGEIKVRFAKNLARGKILEKNGHTAVRLIELDAPMEKADAVVFLAKHADFQDRDAQAAFAAYGKTEKPVKASKAAPLEKVLQAKPAEKKIYTAEEIDAIKAQRLKTIREVHARMKARDIPADEVTTLEVDEDTEMDYDVMSIIRDREVEELEY
jgi:PDZ domain-containing secreted protein